MSYKINMKNYGLSAPRRDSWQTNMNKKNGETHLYYIIQEGNGYILDGKEHLFEKNHLYILPPLKKIKYFLRGNEFYHMYFDFTVVKGLFFDNVVDISLEEYPLIRYDIDMFYYFLKTLPNPYALGVQHNPELYTKYKLRTESFLNILFSDICEYFPPENNTDVRITKALNYIHKNYGGEIKIPELAKELNFSESHFFKVFRKTMGCTPHQYIKNYRLDVACELLYNGTNVSDTALAVGFSCAASFSNFFKEHMGMSPLEYKRNNS